MELNAFTEEQLNSRRRKSAALVCGTALLGIVLVTVGVMTESRQVLLAGVLLLVLIYLAWTNASGPLFSGESRPLDGEGCLRFLQLAESDEKVDALRKSINQQGRPVVWADLWLANTRLKELRDLEMKRACKIINGMPDVVA